MNRIKWSVQMNENLTGGAAHYGQMLVTSANTVILMVRTASNGYDLVAYDGGTGAVKYRIATDYTQPPTSWLVPVQPVLVNALSGLRLYYPGAGGTIWRLDNPDSNTPGTPVRIVFYGTEATYLADQANFNTAVQVNTPITADSDGNLFFGTRVTGTAPAPLSSTQSFLVRIDGATETGTYIDCGTATADGNVSRITHGSAIGLSNDEQTLYVAMKGTLSTTAPYLVAMDATSLTTINKVLLKDPRNGNNASVTDVSTSSPMIAPDDHVYFGVQANPGNGSRGWLLHFNEDLTVEYTAGGFGWDYTPGVVPASMVPSYEGPSTYLLFCKYNNYVSGDGNGINTIAILDPNSTQVDFHSTAPGLVQMRQVLTLASPSADPAFTTWIGAAREWCINASAVNPPNGSVYFNNEDGHAYRWDLSTNSLTESIQLNSGIGQPYVPTVIGPDGTIFTLNGGYMFALGDLDDVEVSLVSSAQDYRTTVAGDSITFTATVSGNSGTPTGTITFEDTTIDSYAPNTVVLAVVPLDGNGQATYTTSALDGGAKALGSNLGNHRIRAIYSGDGTYGPGSVKLAQKIHAFESTTTLGSTGTYEYGDPLTISASVDKVGAGSEIATGYVKFTTSGDVIGQMPLDASGDTSMNTSALKPGDHVITGQYQSDTWFELSSGTTNVTVWEETSSVAVSSNSPTASGANAILNCTVTANDLSAGTPVGTVTFYEGVTALGSSPVDGTGLASLSISTLSSGIHTITAEFEGDSGWYDSTSSSFTHEVLVGAPVATNNSYGVNANGSTNVSAPGPLGNDTGTITSAVLVQSPVNASAFSLNSDGSFSYTPNTGFTGTDTFKYKASGPGGLSNTATVTMNVRAVMDSLTIDVSPIPGGTAITGVVTLTTPAKTGGVPVYFSDGQPWFLAEGYSITVPAGATSAPFSINTTPPPYSVTGKVYATLKNASGISKNASVTIKPLPKAVNDSYKTNANTTNYAVIAPGVLLNDINLLGGTAQLVSGPSNSSSFTLNANGSFDYVPNVGYIGTDTFTYRCVNGGGAGPTATVSINVRAVLASLNVTNTPVTGGNALVGTVSLVGPAPAGGITVFFSDTVGAVQAEGYTVVIPAGQTSAAFSVPTTAVGSPQSGNLNVSLQNGTGITKTKAVTVNP